VHLRSVDCPLWARPCCRTPVRDPTSAEGYLPAKSTGCHRLLTSKVPKQTHTHKNGFRWLCADDWFAMSCWSPRPHNIIINTIFDGEHDAMLNFGLGNLKYDEFWPQTRSIIKICVFWGAPSEIFVAVQEAPLVVFFIAFNFFLALKLA
jgi:hypothetical protein